MKLIIITGVTGKLGEAYLNYFRKQKKGECISITRRDTKIKYKNVRYLFADLLDVESLKLAIDKIDLTKFNKVILIHPIGMFKFESSKKPEKDVNKDGIDDDVFSSNVLTFTNIFNLLKEKLKKNTIKTNLVVCNFGSISDRYNIPFWNSYTKSKNHLRKIIKNAVSKNKLIRIKGIFVNVSTTNTGNERNLRPYARRNYWLTPKEIVESSIKIIEKGSRDYTEINLYKENPNFNPTWYTNHENVLERWETQMKGGLKQNDKTRKICNN